VNGPTPPTWASAIRSKEAELKKTIEGWFDRTMDRVSQRFATSIRMWTIGFSLMLAALLHLDAVALMNKLSQDATLRARLVANADLVMHQTENVIGASGATNVFRIGVDEISRLHPDTIKNLTNVPVLLTQEAANLWLRTAFANNPRLPQILTEFRQIVSSNVLARAPELMGSVGIVHDALASAGLELLPDYRTIQWADYLPTHASFWGMLVSAALLSLGAPFWFNGLKTLLNLRPILASRVQKEEERTTNPK
jgi:hypothetical protein